MIELRAFHRICFALVFILSLISEYHGALGQGKLTHIVGAASVTDGDTIKIDGVRIRVHGIDAPESRQLCRMPDQTQWPCGRYATEALADLIGTSIVTCLQRDRDKYGRVVATCLVAQTDLGAWMVKNGMALAYRAYALDYVEEEEAARRSRAGMWQGEFVYPWKWRRGVRLSS